MIGLLADVAPEPQQNPKVLLAGIAALLLVVTAILAYRRSRKGPPAGGPAAPGG